MLSKVFVPSFVLVNYFWLITVTALLNVGVGVGWLTTLLLPIIIYLMLLKGKIREPFNFIDALWVLCFIWMVCTWLFNDYPHKGTLIVRCFASQIAYMMTYWIARKSSINYLKVILEKAYIPLILTSIIGIYCFIFYPSWYQNIIDNAIANRDGQMTEFQLAELTRLRSIFDSPYTLSYFAAISLIYEWFCITTESKIVTIRYIVYIIILLLVMVLAMMRAPIACVIFSLLIASLYGLKNKTTFGSSATILLIFITAAGVIYLTLSHYMSDFGHLVNKIESVTNDGDGLLVDRLFLMDVDMTVVGDGVGRHAIYADKYPPNYSLRDGEYMKTIAEQGFIGLTLLLLLFFSGMIKGMLYFKKLGFEFCLICMLLFCMIGANPLSTSDKHCILFWLALGQISTYKNKNNNGLNYNSNI